MTPEQQEALVALAGRALTEDEVAAIEPHLTDRNDIAIAEILSAGRTKLQSKYIGTGTILAVMTPNGGAFLDALVQVGGSNRDAFWAMDLIKLGRFDIGEASAQAQVSGLAAAFPEFAEGLAKLKSIGQVADPIHFNVVSNALNKAEGRLTL